jgi:putative nucleotidyltransferase with HDIG domain
MLPQLLPKVLVVDDDPGIRSFIREALLPTTGQIGEAEDAAQALEAMECDRYDIIVCDIWMPGATGMDLLTVAQQSRWDAGFILITGDVQIESVITALRLHVSDFLIKPFTTKELRESVRRTFGRLLTRREEHAYKGSLETSIQRRTRELQVALEELEVNYQMTLEALVAALDAREHETFSHSFRVRSYTRQLARMTGYPPTLLIPLEQGALLHDIGKIAVSDAILLKPSKLTSEEWVEMRKHSTAGEHILRRVPFLNQASLIVRHHHERFDGKGYPDGLKGEQIPLGARLFTVADTLDAMTSNRLYRSALTLDDVREELRRCSGAQFDPRVVGLFQQVPNQLWEDIRLQAEQACASKAAD